MKKKYLYATTAIIVLIIAIVVFYTWGSNHPNSYSNFLFHENGSLVAKIADTKSTSTSKIAGIKVKLPINEQSTEEAVIQAMHEMTHQKVKAKEKWGAIPLTPKTAQVVYDIVNNSDFSHKDELLNIASRWKNGDFSEIVSDHNYFWDLQGGTIGKAISKLSKVEEETFVLNNFGAEAAKEIKNGKM